MNVKNVLVASENAFVRDRFGGVLNDAGLQTVTVSGSGELLACVRPGQPRVDLVLLDLRLAPGDGSRIVRSLRERVGESVPVLVFSGSVADSTEVRHLAAVGVAGYINELSPPQQIVPSLVPHLFPDNFDRRASRRVGLSLPASCRVGAQIASATVVTLGKGGMGLRSLTTLAPGALARVRFRLPNLDRDVEADARVCWADRYSGMGLQFERLTPVDQSAIDAFLDEPH